MECRSKIRVHRKTGFQDEKGRDIVEPVYVPCGRCAQCLANESQQWSLRLIEEWKHAETACFVTLTYDDEHLYINENGKPSVNKRDFQLFMKRLRKKYGKGLRYFCISEYGDDPRSTKRPHYHMLLFNYPYRDWTILRKEIHETWNKCSILNIHATPVNGNRIGYCSNYGVYRKAAPDGCDKNFLLTSRRPGIGACLLESRKPSWMRERGILRVQNQFGSYPLHRYYRNKIVDAEFKDKFEKQYEEFRKKKNLENYGFEDFDFLWNAAEVKEHGLTQEEFQTILHNDEEKIKAYSDFFWKKRKHKHIKL